MRGKVVESFEGEVNGRVEVGCHANVVFKGVTMVGGKEHGREKV